MREDLPARDGCDQPDITAAWPSVTAPRESALRLPTSLTRFNRGINFIRHLRLVHVLEIRHDMCLVHVMPTTHGLGSHDVPCLLLDLPIGQGNLLGRPAFIEESADDIDEDEVSYAFKCVAFLAFRLRYFPARRSRIHRCCRAPCRL